MATSATEAEHRDWPEANGVEGVLSVGNGGLPGLQSADALLLLGFRLAVNTVRSHWAGHEAPF